MVTFRNVFGVYRVPDEVYVDPAKLSKDLLVASSMQGYEFAGYANINNALSYQAYSAAKANSDNYGYPAPALPKYWTVKASDVDAYYDAVTGGGGHFDPKQTPDKFNLPSGVGGSFIR